MSDGDVFSIGWLTLQDWNSSRGLGVKHVMGAQRIYTPDDPNRISEARLTGGHLLGGLFWEENDGDRGHVDTWWATSPPVAYYEPDKSSKVTTTVHARPTGWYPLENADDLDQRLKEKAPKIPEWSTESLFPVGWGGTILSGSKNLERESPQKGGGQDEILLPGFYGLVAPNRNPDSLMGTPVFDLDKSKRPDVFARLQSVFSVEQVKDGAVAVKGDVVALQLGTTGQEGTSGHLLMSERSGPGEPPTVCAGGALAGGPLTSGGWGDSHTLGLTEDGYPITSAHLSTLSLFKGGTFDCPLFFEPGSWPNPNTGPHKMLVHLVNDAASSHPWVGGSRPGLGRWYSDSFFYVDEEKGPEDEIEDGPEDTVEFPPDPGGIIGLPGGTRERDPITKPGGTRQRDPDETTEGVAVVGGGGTAEGSDTQPWPPWGTGGAKAEDRPDPNDSEGRKVVAVWPEGTAFQVGHSHLEQPVNGESPKKRKPRMAVATNTILAGGGLAFRANAWATGEVNLAASPVVTPEQRALADEAPLTSVLFPYATGDGTWGGWTVVGDGSDGDRATANGGIMLLPPGVEPKDVIEGGCSSDTTAMLLLPCGIASLGFGLPNTSTGGISSGTTMTRSGTGDAAGVGFDHYGADGVNDATPLTVGDTVALGDRGSAAVSGDAVAGSVVLVPEDSSYDVSAVFSDGTIKSLSSVGTGGTDSIMTVDGGSEESGIAYEIVFDNSGNIVMEA